jgi:tellurite resistance protein TerC
MLTGHVPAPCAPRRARTQPWIFAMTGGGTPLLWTVFLVAVGAMMVLDLGLFHRRPHVVSAREAAVWSAVWIGLALGFGGLVAWQLGSEPGESYVTGYLIEEALSVDNLFVFYVLFQRFSVKPEHQHRLLFWGIIGALVLRASMVFGGIWLLDRLHWLVYLLGALLLGTGVKMLVKPEAEPHPERGRLFRVLRRIIPTTGAPHGGRLFVRQGGAWRATPLLLVLAMVELTDVVFALDSIPAVFAITRDPFIVLTSNLFAVMGMRSLYFLLADLARRFVYLSPALALVLVFVGAKLALSPLYHLPTGISLAVVALLLGGAVLLSVLRRAPPAPAVTPARLSAPPSAWPPPDRRTGAR